MSEREREEKIFTKERNLKYIDRLLQKYIVILNQQYYFVLKERERERETERSYEVKNFRIDERDFLTERVETHSKKDRQIRI